MKDGKLRLMIITGGGDRQRHMQELFEAILQAHPKALHEAPTYSPGVPSRSLRNRYEFLRFAHEARLIPKAEWQAIDEATRRGGGGGGATMATNKNGEETPSQDPKHLFDALRSVPVTEGRRGSQQDVKLHYSEELWRKAKGLNRGRAVLACTMAHLIAIPKFLDGEFDILLEDNVRAPDHEFVERILEIVKASDDWSAKTGVPCHYRYYGWLGSIPNLKWIYDSHIPARSHKVGSSSSSSDDSGSAVSVFPFPTKHDIEADLARKKETNGSSSSVSDVTAHTASKHADHGDREPGGNAIWGAYGYWISREGYDAFLRVLQHDVGALLWKGKRARHYLVKPIDKILPRFILQHFGPYSVHLPSHPVVFRAPMLTSKIHTQWDPEFCKSTAYQLHAAGGLTWNDLWLTEAEQSIVAHYERTGKWVTAKELEDDDNAKEETTAT